MVCWVVLCKKLILFLSSLFNMWYTAHILLTKACISMAHVQRVGTVTTVHRLPHSELNRWVDTHKWLSLIFMSRGKDKAFNHRHIVSQVIICLTTSIQQKVTKWYVITKHLLHSSDFHQHRSRTAQNWRLVIIWRLHHIWYDDQVCRQSRAAITTFLFCRSC
jgi:hypothetical protein